MKLTECQKLAIMLVFVALITVLILVDIGTWISLTIWAILGICFGVILDNVEIN